MDPQPTFEELRDARLTIDRLTVQHVALLARIGRLERENDALKDMVSVVARGGAGARL